MKRTHLTILLLLALLLSLVVGTTSAQGGVLNYGDTVTQQLDAETPQALYTFNGNAGEVATVYVLGWSDLFQPKLTILGPSGQLAFSNHDALTPMGNDARVTVKVPATGNYSILVGSANGVLDSYTLALRLTTSGVSTALTDAPVTLTIPPNADAQAFTIAGSPDAEALLQIDTLTAGFGVAGYISAPDGHIFVAFDGMLPSVEMALPLNPGIDPYLLIIYAADPTQTGDVSIQLSGGSSAPVQTATQDSASSAGTPPADQCAAVAGINGVNVRSGPGTSYGIITTMAPNDYLIVTGQNYGWYSSELSGQTAWVAGSVITLAGPCDNLPFVDVSNGNPSPVATETPSVNSTTVTETSTSPTATTTGPTATASATTISPTTPPPTTPPPTTVAPTATATATATTAAQIAPPDNQHNLTIDRDDGGQISDAVSYPDGDTSERVRVTIDNLTNFTPNNTRNITLTLVCTGTGTENVSWGTGGPSSPTPNSCGQSTTVFHGYDSNQTYVNINISGPGYVTWTLVATTS